jgi:uncharacterized protein YjdB
MTQITRATDGIETTLSYMYKGVDAFSAEVYLYGLDPLVMFKVYTSANGINWTEKTVQYARVENPLEASWPKYIYNSNGAFPTDTCFVKFVIPNSGVVWGAQIARINLYSTTIPVTGILTTPSTANVIRGLTTALGATILPQNATNTGVVWSSNNEAVATVNSSGVVTGISNGTATITATTSEGGFTANSIITVLPVPVTGVTLDYTTAIIGKTVTKQLTATVNPSNADNKAVTWSSSNPAIATVSTTGLVTGIAAGTAVITVTTVDGGFTATCTVTVKRYDPARYYKITYDSISTLAMDSTTTGLNGVVKNVTYTGATSQQWQIIETTDANTFKIVNRSTGYALKVNSTTNSTGKNIIQATYVNANNMNFTIADSGTYASIYSKLGNKTYIKSTGTSGGTLITATIATTTRWDITLLP